MYGKSGVRGKHLKGKDEVSVLGRLLNGRVESRVLSRCLIVNGGVLLVFKGKGESSLLGKC